MLRSLVGSEMCIRDRTHSMLMQRLAGRTLELEQLAKHCADWIAMLDSTHTRSCSRVQTQHQRQASLKQLLTKYRQNEHAQSKQPDRLFFQAGADDCDGAFMIAMSVTSSDKDRCAVVSDNSQLVARSSSCREWNESLSTANKMIELDIEELAISRAACDDGWRRYKADSAEEQGWDQAIGATLDAEFHSQTDAAENALRVGWGESEQHLEEQAKMVAALIEGLASADQQLQDILGQLSTETLRLSEEEEVVAQLHESEGNEIGARKAKEALIEERIKGAVTRLNSARQTETQWAQYMDKGGLNLGMQETLQTAPQVAAQALERTVQLQSRHATLEALHSRLRAACPDHKLAYRLPPDLQQAVDATIVNRAQAEGIGQHQSDQQYYFDHHSSLEQCQQAVQAEMLLIEKYQKDAQHAQGELSECDKDWYHSTPNPQDAWLTELRQQQELVQQMCNQVAASLEDQMVQISNALSDQRDAEAHLHGLMVNTIQALAASLDQEAGLMQRVAVLEGSISMYSSTKPAEEYQRA
eukprot:TRINITY_DN36659_c0_g2_i1.p1 TRINITY_DN36659_c0_g2~~TRINITY_DN36659_c0_g2_i1.p1  ORF type:complete len:529 (+),score=144.89 TRINITY_DN36659_c0_g2_i1:123-1709(+)